MSIINFIEKNKINKQKKSIVITVNPNGFSNHLYVETLHFYWFIYSTLCCDNAVLMVWLGLGTT